MKIETSDLQKFFETIESKNLSLSLSEVIALINGKIEENNEPLQSTDDIKLIVDYTKTVEQAVADCEFNFANSDINAKNFPISLEMIGTKVEISSKLYHFNRGMGSEDVIKEMDKENCRPAVLMEALALAAAHPELQKQFPIIALGSVWCDSSGSRQVPYLGVGAYDRKLYLDDFGLDWAARCRFLGVRK